MRWYVDPLGEFYDCNEDATVYFDPASGDTHLLKNFAAYLLKQLAAQPMGIEELTARISRDIDPRDLPDLSNLQNTIAELLDELTALDVVEPL